MWDYRAKLLEVVDGDTLNLLIDTGFSGRVEEAIRLKDVFAPEKNQPGGKEVKGFVAWWLGNSMNSALKWPLQVYTRPNTKLEPDEIRTFTRYVGVVQATGALPTLNEALIMFLAQHPEWGKGIGG